MGRIKRGSLRRRIFTKVLTVSLWVNMLRFSEPNKLICCTSIYSMSQVRICLISPSSWFLLYFSSLSPIFPSNYRRCTTCFWVNISHVTCTPAHQEIPGVNIIISSLFGLNEKYVSEHAENDVNSGYQAVQPYISDYRCITKFVVLKEKFGKRAIMKKVEHQSNKDNGAPKGSTTVRGVRADSSREWSDVVLITSPHPFLLWYFKFNWGENMISSKTLGHPSRMMMFKWKYNIALHTCKLLNSPCCTVCIFLIHVFIVSAQLSTFSGVFLFLILVLSHVPFPFLCGSLNHTCSFPKDSLNLSFLYVSPSRRRREKTIEENRERRENTNLGYRKLVTRDGFPQLGDYLQPPHLCTFPS
ncbi:hypothetical protein VP01_177g1 [Puccinia sorghi]|uniref:Uncharacterized protein n=1 Tax=Puccinia sorghi TaxID=27349 RepID=A0A0L6VF80_9BASI|nr:hypothetical protein VP01_177g1 [Puccinia sorghi]